MTITKENNSVSIHVNKAELEDIWGIFQNSKIKSSADYMNIITGYLTTYEFI